MANEATNKQKKDDILNADIEHILHEEDKLKEKLKDSSHLEHFAKDLWLFMSLIKDYYQGNYRQIPYKSLSAGIVGLLYTLNPIDLIPDFIPFIGHIDDALVLTFCLKLVEKDLQKYQVWKASQSTAKTSTDIKKHV